MEIVEIGDKLEIVGEIILKAPLFVKKVHLNWTKFNWSNIFKVKSSVWDSSETAILSAKIIDDKKFWNKLTIISGTKILLARRLHIKTGDRMREDDIFSSIRIRLVDTLLYLFYCAHELIWLFIFKYKQLTVNLDKTVFGANSVIKLAHLQPLNL